MRRAVEQADLVVGAVLLPGRAAPKLLLREDLSAMKPGADLGNGVVRIGAGFPYDKVGPGLRAPRALWTLGRSKK